VVDDVVTTGASLLRAIQNVREEGGIPVYAVVVVDRNQGARELLKSNGVELISLTTALDIFRELYLKGFIDVETYLNITNYIKSFTKV